MKVLMGNEHDILQSFNQDDNAYLTVNKELRRCQKDSLDALKDKGRGDIFYEFSPLVKKNCSTVLVLKAPGPEGRQPIFWCRTAKKLSGGGECGGKTAAGFTKFGSRIGLSAAANDANYEGEKLLRTLILWSNVVTTHFIPAKVLQKVRKKPRNRVISELFWSC
jgi:hypothetical protein